MTGSILSRHFLWPAAAFAIAVLLVAPSWAANPCEEGGAASPSRVFVPGTGAGGSGIGGIGGIGGTGQTPGEAGIGGTGRASEPADIGGTGQAQSGGIGGTGEGPKEPGDGGIGGTGYVRGIFGTVTGYASLCVAGIEVHYDAASLPPKSGDTAEGTPPAIGETVEILAQGDGDSVRALSVVSSPILAGPVEAIDTQNGTMRVLSQNIAFDLSARSAIVGEDDVDVADAGLEVGEYVRVHGLRREDSVVAASRIDRTSNTDLLVRGRITQTGQDWVQIGGLSVSTTGLHDSAPAVGDDVLLSGHLSDGRMVASTSRRPFALLSERRVRRLDVETYVAPNGQEVTFGNRRLAVPLGTASPGGGRMRLAARVNANGTLVFNRLRPPIAWRPPVLRPRPLPPVGAPNGGAAPGQPSPRVAPPLGSRNGADRPPPVRPPRLNALPPPPDRLRRSDRPPRPPEDRPRAFAQPQQDRRGLAEEPGQRSSAAGSPPAPAVVTKTPFGVEVVRPNATPSPRATMSNATPVAPRKQVLHTPGERAASHPGRTGARRRQQRPRDSTQTPGSRPQEGGAGGAKISAPR